MANLCCANSESNRAESAVGRRMAIAADNGHAGLGRAELRSHHMHDPAMITLPAVRFDPMFLGIRQKGLDLRFGLLRMVRWRAVGIDERWRRMINRREGPVWTADF